jgi:hypothetical protein
MADITIRFRHNPKTGQRELVIAYESESDALPHEHERDHRNAVTSLLGPSMGAAQGAEVSREETKGEPAEAATEPGTANRQAERAKG